MKLKWGVLFFLAVALAQAYAIDINSCTNITSPGIYTLTQSISNSDASACINITISNVAFDAQGFTIDGSDTAATVGISASNSTNALENVTVQNAYLTDWNDGIIYTNSPRGRILNNVISSSPNYGIYALSNSNYTNITNNTVNDNSYGILISTSSYIQLVNNTANSNSNSGFYIVSDVYNITLLNNTANSNYYGIYLYGVSNNSLIQNTISGNVASGLIVRGSSLNWIEGNTFSSSVSSSGIYLLESSNRNAFINNTISLYRDGITVSGSSFNNLTNNTARTVTRWGFISDTNAIDNKAANLDVGPVISFNGKDIAVGNASYPSADPSGYRNISKWINATNQSADSWLYLNISYTNNEAYLMNESSIFIGRHNGSWEISTSSFASPSGIDLANNYVYANITNFSTGRIFAPLGLPRNFSCLSLNGSICGYASFCNANIINSSDEYFCCSQPCTSVRQNAKKIYHWPYLTFSRYTAFDFTERLTGDITPKRALYFGYVVGSDGVFITARGQPNIVEGNWYESLYTSNAERDNITNTFLNFQNNYSKYGVYDNVFHMHAHPNNTNIATWRANIITAMRQKATVMKAVGMRKILLDFEFSNQAAVNQTNAFWDALGRDIMGNLTEIHPQIEMGLYPGLVLIYQDQSNKTEVINPRHALYKGLYDGKGTGQIWIYDASTYGVCDLCIVEPPPAVYLWNLSEVINTSKTVYNTMLGPDYNLVVANWEFRGATSPSISNIESMLTLPSFSQNMYKRTMNITFALANNSATWDGNTKWDDDTSLYLNFSEAEYEVWLANLSQVELQSIYQNDTMYNLTHWIRISNQSSNATKLSYFRIAQNNGVTHIKGSLYSEFPDYLKIAKTAAGKPCTNMPLYSQDDLEWATNYSLQGLLPNHRAVPFLGSSSYAGLLNNICTSSEIIPISSSNIYYAPSYVNLSENFILNITISAPPGNNVTQLVIRSLRFAINGSSNGTSLAVGVSNFVSAGHTAHWVNLTAAPLVNNGTNQSFYIMMNTSIVGSPTEGMFQVCLYNNTDLVRSCENDSYRIAVINTQIGVNLGFSGYVKLENGSFQNGTNVTLYEFVNNISGPPSEIYMASVLTNTGGLFRFAGINGSKSQYKLKMFYNNGTATTRVGNALPPMPSMMFYQMDLGANSNDPKFKKPVNLNGTTFYLQPAATLNITAIGNVTGAIRVKFGYEIIDQSLGFPVESNILAATYSQQVAVPTGRAYTVMASRNQFSFVNNATCTGVGVMTLDACPAPPTSRLISQSNLTEGSIVDIVMNMSFGTYSLSGCIGTYGNNSAVNVTTFNMKMMPWEGFIPPMDAEISEFNITNGSGNIAYRDQRCPGNLAFYNITTMGSASGITYMLEFYAKNASTDAGNPGTAISLAAFQNVTVQNTAVSLNLTLRPMGGAYDTTTGGVNTTKIKVNVQNSTGGAISTGMHIDAKVKNPAFGTVHYIVESTSGGSFFISVLNNSNWAKVMVFPQEGPPVEKTLNLSLAENNITVWTGETGFRRMNSSGNLEQVNVTNPAQKINMTFYRYADGCNLPMPPAGCLLTQIDVQDFNPMALMMAGKVNLEMKFLTTNTTLYFVNFDLFAAKPPTNSVLNGNASRADSSAQSQIWEAGSFVPDVYDYAFIGMPYNSSSTAIDYINESYRFNMSLPYLKDENWNTVWNLSASDTISNLPDEYTEYNTNEYSGLLSAVGVNCSTSNASEVCFMNQSQNMFWTRIPHFSGGGYGINGGTDIIITSVATSSGSGNSQAMGGGLNSSYPETQTIASIIPGEQIIVTATNPESIGLSSILFIANEALENVRLSFYKIISLPEEITETPNGEIYKYFRIDAPKLDGKLTELKIRFEVKKLWLADNGFADGDVTLQYFNNNWETLSTTITGDDADDAYFEAAASEFGYFAITAFSQAEQTIPEAVPEKSEPEEQLGLIFRALSIILDVMKNFYVLAYFLIFAAALFISWMITSKRIS